MHLSRGWFLGFVALVGVLIVLQSAEARCVRIATYNVEHGIGAVGSEKYEAQKAVLKRIDADIVAFQELKTNSSNEWARLAGELGYPHRVWGEEGPFSGNMSVGFFSRFPILAASSVVSPKGLAEFSRFPLRVTIDVPDAARPLTLWNMHHKAIFGYVDSFRRAVEAYRVVKDIERLLEEHPEHLEFVVLGDMNDDFAREDQPYMFRSIPRKLPGSYIGGTDIPLPLPYRAFPHAPYLEAGGGMKYVQAFRQDSTNRISHLYTQFTLDYIYVSKAIAESPLGAPRGEVYHSEWDRDVGGLRKAGERLPPEISLLATDHYPVFADINLEDAE
jgi:endonuclease/exonuclease/phosphatase family metal-dependent hydrolase